MGHVAALCIDRNPSKRRANILLTEKDLVEIAIVLLTAITHAQCRPVYTEIDWREFLTSDEKVGTAAQSSKFRWEEG